MSLTGVVIFRVNSAVSRVGRAERANDRRPRRDGTSRCNEEGCTVRGLKTRAREGVVSQLSLSLSPLYPRFLLLERRENVSATLRNAIYPDVGNHEAANNRETDRQTGRQAGQANKTRQDDDKNESPRSGVRECEWRVWSKDTPERYPPILFRDGGGGRALAREGRSRAMIVTSRRAGTAELSAFSFC